MSDYIINPVWFYWVNVATGLKIFCVAMCAVGFVTAITAAIQADTSSGYGGCEEDYKHSILAIKISIIVIIVFALLAVFIPSKTALIEMQIARYATYNNAEWTMETVKAAVDYIVEAMKSIRGA